MSLKVTPFTLPAAGVDDVDITIEETYEVEGLGSDTVLLKGRLVAERTVPLLEHGATRESWEDSTVAARFTKLELYGESSVFGPVIVKLNEELPAFGIVSAGKCKAALPIEVSMPRHGLVLQSEEPVQLHSNVTTVPPIGDEKTVSVKAVSLVDIRTQRTVGRLNRARVAWRDLRTQTVSLAKDKGETLRAQAAQAGGGSEARLDRVLQQIGTLMVEVQAIRKELGR